MGESAGFYQKMPKFREPSLDLIPNLSTVYTLPNPPVPSKIKLLPQKNGVRVLKLTLYNNLEKGQLLLKSE